VRGITRTPRSADLETLLPRGIYIELDPFNIFNHEYSGVTRAGLPVSEDTTIIHDLTHAKYFVIDIGWGGGTTIGSDTKPVVLLITSF